MNTAKLAEAIDYEVDGLIRSIGHDPLRQAGAWHAHLLRNKRNEIQLGLGEAARPTQVRYAPIATKFCSAAK